MAVESLDALNQTDTVVWYQSCICKGVETIQPIKLSLPLVNKRSKNLIKPILIENHQSSISISNCCNLSLLMVAKSVGSRPPQCLLYSSVNTFPGNNGRADKDVKKTYCSVILRFIMTIRTALPSDHSEKKIFVETCSKSQKTQPTEPWTRSDITQDNDDILKLKSPPRSGDFPIEKLLTFRRKGRCSMESPRRHRKSRPPRRPSGPVFGASPSCETRRGRWLINDVCSCVWKAWN